MIPALIGLFFGFLWLLIGLSGLSDFAALAGLVAGLLVFGVAARRIVRRRTRRNKFDRRYYAAAVIAEVIAIWAAQRWLSDHGRADLLFPVVGVIVGLHFIGLWRSADDRRYLWLAGALVLVNVVAIILPLSRGGRAMVAGFGSSLSLLVAASA